jgi:hypothetical protein
MRAGLDAAERRQAIPGPDHESESVHPVVGRDMQPPETIQLQAGWTGGPDHDPMRLSDHTVRGDGKVDDPAADRRDLGPVEPASDVHQVAGDLGVRPHEPPPLDHHQVAIDHALVDESRIDDEDRPPDRIAALECGVPTDHQGASAEQPGEAVVQFHVGGALQDDLLRGRPRGGHGQGQEGEKRPAPACDAPRGHDVSSRKFATSRAPWRLATDSGWNCTPQTGYWR